MSISIEDILRGHGIGASNGLQIIKSSTEPTTGLSEGLVWYNTTSLETKMYLDGAFKDLGGAGGVLLTPFFGQATTASVTNIVNIPVAIYNPLSDVLLVTQNGTPLTESVDFAIDKQAKRITKITGNWDSGTFFGFTALAMTKTSKADNVTLVKIEDHVNVAAGITQVNFSIPGFNPDLDVLTVHQRNLQIFDGVNYTIHPSGSAITLNYTLDEPEEFHFTVLKKVRDQVPSGQFDGALLINGSVPDSALGASVNHKLQESQDAADYVRNTLSDFKNYGIATQAEAEAGASNTKYMTPLRTKEAVAKLTPKNVPNGYVGLDSNGKTPTDWWSLVRHYSL